MSVESSLIDEMLARMEIMDRELGTREDDLVSLRSEIDSEKKRNEELEKKCRELEERAEVYKCIVEGMSEVSGVDGAELRKIIISDLVAEIVRLREASQTEGEKYEKAMHLLLEDCYDNVEYALKISLQQHEEAMERLREEYLAAKTAKQGETSREGLFQKFKALPEKIKGVVLAIIGAIKALCARWIGWGFIHWMWERIVATARWLYEHRAVFGGLVNAFNAISKTGAYTRFMRDWEQNGSMRGCWTHLASTEFVKEILKVAPHIINTLVADKK